MAKKIILILGGTSEASEIAELLVKLLGHDSVITSLAGSTISPKPLCGIVRNGGFGGVSGLTQYIIEEEVSLVIDATHPFAERISKNAAEACLKNKVPRTCLHRPPWKKKNGDKWHEVKSLAGALETLPYKGKRVFLSLGSRAVNHFSNISDIWFLVRVVDQPILPLDLNDYQIVCKRGPFKVSEEKQLLEDHQIDLMVTRNSGGSGAYAKIVAARELKIPVIIIKRPLSPVSEVVSSINEVYKWLGDQLGRKICV